MSWLINYFCLFKFYLENEIDGEVIKFLTSAEIKTLIPDMKSQIKFRIMMDHLIAAENQVI